MRVVVHSLCLAVMESSQPQQSHKALRRLRMKFCSIDCTQLSVASLWVIFKFFFWKCWFTSLFIMWPDGVKQKPVVLFTFQLNLVSFVLLKLHSTIYHTWILRKSKSVYPHHDIKLTNCLLSFTIILFFFLHWQYAFFIAQGLQY